MKDVVYKTVTFVKSGDMLHGYYFYDSSMDSAEGHIFGVRELTLPKALSIIKEKGIDPISDTKFSISAYYW